jgi:hypothetical protein
MVDYVWCVLLFWRAQNMEEEVDKTLERTRKNEYYNILKLFCLGDLMLVVMFL